MRSIPYLVTPLDDDQHSTPSGERQRTMFRAQQPDGSQRLEIPNITGVAPAHDWQWLWEGRIPLGQVTLIAGDAGAGKSFVALDLAARFTCGKLWPDPAGAVAGSQQRNSGDVLLICPQDDESAVSRRLMGLGADLSHIRQLQDVATCDPRLPRAEKRRLLLPYDLPMLRQELEENDSIALVVIDPLSDVCAGPQSLTETLRQLDKLARDQGVAIVVTLPAQCRFDAKGALRVSSRWRTEAARWVWCVVADPDDPARRMFVPWRTNYCAEPPGLSFRLERGHVVWNPSALVDPHDPLGQQTGARSCLDELLREGHRPAKEIFGLGAQCGFSPRQLRAAAKRQGIESHKGPGFGGDGGFVWYTPEQRAELLAGEHEMIPALDAPADASVNASVNASTRDVSEHASADVARGPAQCVADTVAELELMAESHDVPVAPAPSTLESAVIVLPAAADSPPASRAIISESLEKPVENAPSAGAALPRERYQRQRERRRRLQEKRNQSCHSPAAVCQ